MSTRHFKYHAALSFAGENRKFAESLFHSLTGRGFRVFYDADREAHLWGKKPKEFLKIYGPQSRYVIPIISKYYVDKPWTQYEFDAALKEQQKRRSEFILPIRMDDTPLLGLSEGVIRQDGRKKSSEDIAELFAAKCRRSRGVPISSSLRGAPSPALGLLSHDARRVLDLVATAAVPLPLAYFEKLFPKYPWRKLIARFRRAGLLERQSFLLKLNKSTLKAFGDDKDHRRSVNQVWIDRLTPLAANYDTAALLSVHLILAKRFEEAARVAVNIAQATRLGWWNQIYVTILSGLARLSIIAKLKRQTQVEVLNSLGTCLAEAGQFSEAMARFKDLRRRSVRYRNSWGVGQSWINAGVAAARNGDNKAAEQLYSQAAAHARRTRDSQLLGRALNNLSQLHMGTDIDLAEELLEASIRAKVTAKDTSGLVAGLAVRGNLAARRGKFELAAHYYQQSARAAERLGLHYEYALSTYNRGRALQDSCKIRPAERFYRRALDIARRDHYVDILSLSLNALAASAFSLGRYGDAHRFSCNLFDVARRANNQEYELSALHGCAVSLLARRRNSESKRAFRRAVRRAKECKAVDWAVRCLVDSTRRVSKNGLGAPDPVQLRRIAKAEVARHQHAIASEMWNVVTRISASRGTHQATSDAFGAAANSFKNKDSDAKRLDLYRNWFNWAWGVWRVKEALRVLKRMEDLGYRSGNQQARVAAVDQRGVCLQELERYSEAESLHRFALAAAKQMCDRQQQERSLNNLGEALRRQGRNKEALNPLRQSERIARKTQHHEGATSAAHNRALALEAMGQVKASERVLIKCRNDAERHQLWFEYVRAWEALANLAWTTGRPSVALRLYQRARVESRARRITETAPRIALNFARFLRSQRKFRAALRTLEPYRSQFEGIADAYMYFGTLADLYDQVGKLDEAVAAWKAAYGHATRLGNNGYASYCSAQEAMAHEKLQEQKISETSILAALRVARVPRRRAEILIQQLQFLLRKKVKRRVQPLFEDALRFCQEHRLFEQKAKLYMLVGDSSLSGTYKGKCNAFKAYAMAMMAALEGLEADNTSFATVASHIVSKIASASSPIREHEIELLVNDLKAQLVQQAPNADAVIGCLLWPFDIARQLLPLRDRPRQFEAAVQQLASPANVTKYLTRIGRPRP